MKVRKLNRHRARLSFLKPWGYWRRYDGKLEMWNSRGRPGWLR